jgi:predicted  nucleic acid-binding Zn-ribbon protein
MKRNLIQKSAIVLSTAVLLAGFLFIDSNAQKRKRRTRRRPSAPQITNPEIYQPPANDNSNSNAADANANTATQPAEDPDAMKKTIRSLSDQVDRLNQKLGQVEQSQQSMVDLERLSRAEQRSAQMRSELRDVQQKKGELEAHLEDVEYALKPENIERATAGYGTTRPEDVREQRRKQLESERERVRKQLAEFQSSEDRLQQAIATSDAEVDRLQKKLDAADRSDIENAKTRSQAEASPSPTPTP